MSFKYKDKLIAGSGGGSSEEVYSIEEVRIGTWIDGKPLYRKVYTGTTPAAGTATPMITIPRDIEIVTIFGMVNGHFVLPAYGSAQSFIKVWRAIGDATNIYMETGGADYQNKPYIAIIQYTKTTDQAAIQVQESSQITKSEKQEKSDYQDFIAPVTSGI